MDFLSRKSNDFSLNFLQDQSEILQFDSAVNLMSSQNFHIENLASKEQISLKHNQSIQKLKEEYKKFPLEIKKKDPEKLLSIKKKSSRNYKKNLLILKRSMEYITKFEDSEGEEDAVALSPTCKLKKSNKIKSTHKENNKKEFITSNDYRYNSKRQINYEELDKWVQSKNENVGSKKQIISVYQKDEEFVVTKKNFFNPSKTKKSKDPIINKTKSYEGVKTIEDQTTETDLEQNTKLKNSKSLQDNFFQKNNKNSKKSLKGEKMSRRRYSVYDRLASKKYKQLAVEENRKNREIEEMKECTFKPSINKLSSMICSFKELNTSKNKRGKF